MRQITVTMTVDEFNQFVSGSIATRGENYELTEDTLELTLSEILECGGEDAEEFYYSVDPDPLPDDVAEKLMDEATEGLIAERVPLSTEELAELAEVQCPTMI